MNIERPKLMSATFCSTSLGCDGFVVEAVTGNCSLDWFPISTTPSGACFGELYVKGVYSVRE